MNTGIYISHEFYTTLISSTMECSVEGTECYCDERNVIVLNRSTIQTHLYLGPVVITSLLLSPGTFGCYRHLYHAPGLENAA